jgi:predicted O-methyltransferase YrrM
MNLEKATQIHGWMPDNELRWIAETASTKNNILELGAFLGRSTRAICDNTNGKVTTVDLWTQENNLLIADFSAAYGQFQDNLKEHINSAKLHYVQMSTDFAIEHMIGSGYKFDFIFIDACHEYEQVSKDIKGCLTFLLADGGIISGHDFNWEGVERAVKELLPDYKLFSNIWYWERK